jgi:hypothetical protein
VLVHLPVVRFVQKPGLCGAATAQMILHYKNLIGNQVADQDALWAQITTNTGGARPLSPPANIASHDCPPFATQQCDKCVGATVFQCWCTFPPALLATLQSYNLPFAMLIPATGQAATADVIASVDFDIPAAALVQAGLHWIAVAGYETGGANPQLIGGRAISAIYIRNPEVGAANQGVPIDTWIDDYMTPTIQCGGFLNKLVVVVATAQAPTPQAPAAPTNVRVRRRPKPKRPPRKKPRPRIPKPRNPPDPPRPRRKGARKR